MLIIFFRRQLIWAIHAAQQDNTNKQQAAYHRKKANKTNIIGPTTDQIASSIITSCYLILARIIEAITIDSTCTQITPAWSALESGPALTLTLLLNSLP